MDLEAIPLETITGSVYQPRLQEDRQLERLLQSIELNGLRVPIVVKRKGKGAYRVVCGHRRVKALSSLLKRGATSLPAGEARISQGRCTVSALVMGPGPDQEAALTGFIENDERLDLGPYEQAVCYRTFVEELGFTRKELALRLGLDRTRLDYMIAALSAKSLTAKMIQAWKERKLSNSHVMALFRLRRYRERQKELFQMIIARRLTATDAKFWCNQLLAAPDRPLEEREYDRLEERLLLSPKLKTLIDKKWLRLGRSSRGERVVLNVSDEQELLSMAQAIVSALRPGKPG